MVRYTLKQCSYFLAVADHGGIAQAARSLNISQPAVSQALEKLEQTFGLSLLVRHHARGTELTPQGRAFYSLARELVRQAQGVESKAIAIAANLAGSIRFGCFHTIAPFHLIQIVKSYAALYPDVIIEAKELLQDEILAGIAAGDLDLAMTYDMTPRDPLLERQPIAGLKPFILLSSTHHLASRASVALAELADEPFVMFDGPSSREYFQGILDAHSINPPVAFHSRSMEAVRCAVAGGLGFSLSVMRPVHTQTYDGGQVTAIEIADDVDAISVVLVRRRSEAHSVLVEEFGNFCTAHFDDTL